MGCKSSDQKPKPKYRKGLWSPEEDQRLRNYVLRYGHGCWSSVPINAALQRNGKSCRLRWINYLRPGLRRGTFSIQEEETILTLHRLLGNKWSQMARHLPGRTDNEIKNYWHSYLKKRVLKAEGIQESSSTTDSTKSPSPSKVELSQPSKPTTPVPSHNDTSETMEKSTSESCGQSAPPLFDKEANKNPLPKIMFAEWLSLDCFASLGDQGMVSGKGPTYDHIHPSFQDNFMNGNFLFNEETFGSGYQHSLSDGSAAGDLFSSQFKFEGQSSASDQFVDFSSAEDICIGFNVNNDVNVMYI